jgi:aminoglycoside phosphotransferase (APT) family kinase protein
LCEDNAVIGAPFYLMERVEGAVIRNKLPPALSGPAERAALADELVRALAALHSVDFAAAGLATLGKPEGYVARQVKRWIGQLDGARTRDLPDLDAVSAWLQGHIPESPAATIVHGDFRLDNVIYAPQAPVKLLAVLDWEMSTLGDPLADLGYLLSFWREPGEAPATPLPDDMGDVTASGGFPARAEVAARYEELTGRKATHLNFYMVLAIWKLAILLEGSYKRHQQGTTDDPFFAMLGEGVPALARRARAMI